MKEGRIGNAKAGKGEWLVIEADESDGSIVQYKPEVGVLLNVDKDHKEMDALMEIFSEFRKNTQQLFVVNRHMPQPGNCPKMPHRIFLQIPHFRQAIRLPDSGNRDWPFHFKINGVEFTLNTVGKHNMENALAASAVASQLGVDLSI